MLESLMVAHQRNYDAIMCFKDKAVLSQVNADPMIVQELDAQDGIESHAQRDYKRSEGPNRC